ncbi:MAG: hypothetical protein ACOVLC_10890 [Flavobacterium sp.]
MAKKYFIFKLPQNCGKINTIVEIATDSQIYYDESLIFDEIQKL